MTTIKPVQMIRACSLSLDNGRLVSTRRLLRSTVVESTAGGNRCPAHDDVLETRRTGVCLDNFWSQQHLASLGLREVWRLWRSWRKAVRP